MTFRTKGVTGFQFKIRFNSSPEINSWEAWTYRAGDTVGTTAKWMQVSKDTAQWYQEAKGAIVEAYAPEVTLKKSFVGDSDILIADIVNAVTVRRLDDPIVKHSQSTITTIIQNYELAEAGSTQEILLLKAIKKHMKIIADRRIEIDPITDWSKEMIAFDDSNIQEL